MCCGNSILQKGLPFFYLHKIFYTLFCFHKCQLYILNDSCYNLFFMKIFFIYFQLFCNDGSFFKY
ncbi:hypothetical protein EGW49_12610 [Enterococcus hirae]|nr:hypothetical protein EGW49_12610 [Enterococcus hirae]ROY00299.1 hypothetical protein EGW54_12575 [Enterococcus hirae]ROY47183.1 hypothetical protein EGW66_12635 [Enterococcus hirae]